MSSQESLPDLLRVGQVTEMLGVGRPQLQNLFPHLHILAFPRNTRRFPLPYILNLQNYLVQADERPSLKQVKKFAISDLARYAITNAEVSLETALSTHVQDGRISAADTARIFNFGRMSVSDWIVRHELTAVEGASARQNSHVSEESLRALYHWEYPEAIRGNYPSPQQDQ